MMKGMDEESKREQADRFDQNKADSLKKMQEIQQLMMSSSGAVIDEDGENEDEFDDYMEQKLLQEAEGLGILDKNQPDAAAVYVDALKRVEEEVKKAPKDIKDEEEKKENGEEEELEKYQDDLMN